MMYIIMGILQLCCFVYSFNVASFTTSNYNKSVGPKMHLFSLKEKNISVCRRLDFLAIELPQNLCVPLPHLVSLSVVLGWLKCVLEIFMHKDFSYHSFLTIFILFDGDSKNSLKTILCILLFHLQV